MAMIPCQTSPNIGKHFNDAVLISYKGPNFRLSALYQQANGPQLSRHMVPHHHAMTPLLGTHVSDRLEQASLAQFWNLSRLLLKLSYFKGSYWNLDKIHGKPQVAGKRTYF
jgi:hypothetical protein